MHTHIEGGSWRFWFRDPWAIEISWSLNWFQLGVEYGVFVGCEAPHLRLAVPFVALYITLPIRHDRPNAVNGWMYGFCVRSDALTIHYGDDTGRRGSSPWYFEWPWRRWHHVRHDVYGKPKTYPYRYHMNSGEIQERQATIQIEEREWRWLWKRSPWKKVSRYIDVKFDKEVGEKTGSWKGGCIGCSYDLKPRETPIMCLRRMERERTF